MTTNDYFDQEMRVMTPDKVLQPRAFALCWGTASRLYIFRTAAPSLLHEVHDLHGFYTLHRLERFAWSAWFAWFYIPCMV